MNKWLDALRIVAESWKALAGVAAGVAALSIYLTTYQTDVEAAEWRTAHNQAETCRIVADLKAEIREKEARIRFDAALTDADRQWLRDQIDAIRQDIKRYDPEGKC